MQELTRAQQVVARRVAEAKAIVPELAVQTDVAMDRAVERAARAGARVDDLVVRASALALRETPRANASYRDGHFELYSRVNVGVTVTTGDALAVATVHDADRKSLGELAQETRSLEERAHAGTLSPADLRGATFTVVSAGASGATALTPVINAPQAATLGAGAVREAPVVRDGAVVPGRVLRLTLVCDHRILHPEDAAGFLGRIRDLLELADLQ